MSKLSLKDQKALKNEILDLMHQGLRETNPKKKKEIQEKIKELREKLDPYVTEREESLLPKAFQRLKVKSAPLFIGHKLLLQDLQKQAKDERKALGIINKLQEYQEDKYQAAYFCKDYTPDLVYYWHIGGRKLTPTLKEIDSFISKYWNGEYKSFNDLPSSIRYAFRKQF